MNRINRYFKKNTECGFKCSVGIVARIMSADPGSDNTEELDPDLPDKKTGPKNIEK